jgi:hypothetical protein
LFLKFVIITRRTLTCLAMEMEKAD